MIRIVAGISTDGSRLYHPIPSKRIEDWLLSIEGMLPNYINNRAKRFYN
jgi:hypothetical protein